jgi:thioesterase domain-containing protein
MRNLSLLSPQGKLIYIQQKVGKSMRHIASKIFPRLRPPLSRVLQDVGEAGLLAVRAYVPQIYPGRVTVFRTNGRRLRFFQDAHLGWNKVVLGGVKICQVGGDHGSMLEEPHMRALAEKLQAYLDETPTYATR